jgi:phosphopantothenoylcysteine decarboxylase/phosphopantothenate--cysteine ligase
MNVRMWQHAATRRNVARLRSDGVEVIEPDEGEMACGEYGPGRLPEPQRIFEAIQQILPGTGRGTARSAVEGLALSPAQPLHQPPPLATAGPPSRPGEELKGRHVIVTAGPTHEPIDPVRVIANRSSGKQGFAIAAALAELGGRVTLVAGPVALDTPPGVDRIDVETAEQMHAAVNAALPADAAILVAAVADWAVDATSEKLKKSAGPPQLVWRENPDILAALGRSGQRPRLLVGFAAETADVVESATEKRLRKGCDWILANDVSGEVMGGDRNAIHLITADGVEHWADAPKAELARRLAKRIADEFA